MVSDEHALLRENIPAYAIGALDAEDAAALEAHLHTCESCRRELASYRAVSDNLLAATPPREPSPALRQRLQSQLPSARSAQKQKSQLRFRWSFGQLAMGAAFLLLFAMSLASFLQTRALQAQQANLFHQVQNSQVALAMLSYPGTETLTFHEGSVAGSVLVDRDRSTAALVAWNLPQLPAQQIYQIWLIEPNGHRVSAGLFRSQADQPYTTEPIVAQQNISNFIGIGVTVEPAGGSNQPTGPRVFKVDL